MRLLVLAFVGFVPSISSAQGATGEIAALYRAEAYYEYAKDGAAPIGVVTKRLADDKVMFTMCDNKTVEVLLADLRPSSGKCETKKRFKGTWLVDAPEVAPVYRAQLDPNSTLVMYDGKTVDLKKIKGWDQQAVPVPPAGKASEPVGFVFKDAYGQKSMAIFESAPRLKTQ